MSVKYLLVIAALGWTLANPKPGRPEPSAITLPPEAEQVARSFLEAFSRNDREAVSSMLPTSLANLYGPCPFDGAPQLNNPRADTRTGAIDFQGASVDQGLPSRGTMVMRLVEQDGSRAWRVRQIFWYTELPPDADLPDSSPTPEDRAQEPALQQAATEFVQAWLSADYQTMDGLTFHWWEVPRAAPRWIRMRSVNLEARAHSLNGLRVDFVASLRVARIIPKSVRGNLWLVQEGNQWRVRPVSFSLWF
ncbi:MAG: hypothetical protein IMF16_04420 [Proteobacteria bacterium]|nr:hypothetical protein [Pseudomonadota bacterium]